jgi:hypothetical protein
MSDSPFKTPQERKVNGRIADEEMNQLSQQSSDNEAQSVDVFYTLREKTVLKTNLEENTTKQVFSFNHCESTKLAYT